MYEIGQLIYIKQDLIYELKDTIRGVRTPFDPIFICPICIKILDNKRYLNKSKTNIKKHIEEYISMIYVRIDLLYFKIEGIGILQKNKLRSHLIRLLLWHLREEEI